MLDASCSNSWTKQRGFLVTASFTLTLTITFPA
jgi:hypothetical protein